MRNELLFKNEELNLEVRTIYNEDGSISVNAEDTARGFGWTQIKNGKEYVKWERVNGFIEELGFSPKVGKEDYVPESLFYLLGMKADNDKARNFQMWLATEVIPEVRKSGKYNPIEQKIMLIEDEKERTLTMELYKLNELQKINPSDMITNLQIKNKEQELELYKQSKKLEAIDNKVEKIEKIAKGIEKATVLREGDSNAYIVADRFGIYSTNNKAHNQFASKMAKILGIYVNPEGNGGYQDEYVSVNLTNFGGKTTATLMYSEKAIDKMREYIEENGLLLKPVYYIKGNKKGQFKEAILYLDGEDSYIKVNETTYNKYLDK